MSGMSTYQKFLYIMSIITVVLGVCYALLGVFVLVTGEASSDMIASGAAYGYSSAELATMEGASFIVVGIIYAIVGALGIVGTRNPAKLGPFAVIMYILAILCLLSFVANIAMGTFTWQTFSSLIPVVMAYAAYTVRKDYKANK